MVLGKRVFSHSDVLPQLHPHHPLPSGPGSVPPLTHHRALPPRPDPKFGSGEHQVRTSHVLSPTGLQRKQCPTCGERYPVEFKHCPRDASQLREVSAADADPLLGSVLGDTYHIVRVIGEGGMGRVYEARHVRLPTKRLAIKVLHGDLVRQSLVVDRFLREAEATGALQHPNIAGALDVNELPDGRPYIVAELLEGDQLGAYFAQHGRLSVEEAVAICRPICQALIAAHARGIVHRDIKPENLFLVGTGRSRTTKVLDFGISRVGSAAAKLTKTGTVMGTPTYMPPEQARGRRVDARADVYSVGAILYEAVTGTRPFEGADQMATLAAVLTEDPARPRSLVPTIPPGLELVIQKAMAKLPRDRYASMLELDDALEEFDAGFRSPQRPNAPSRTSEPPSLETQLFRIWGGEGNAPEQARASLAAYSVFGALYLLAGCLEVSLGSVRLSRAAEQLTGAELAFAMLASFGLLLAPSLVWTWFLAKRVWSSTPMVMMVLDRTRHVLGASLGTYAGLTLLQRILASTFHLEHSGLDWPGWGILSFLIATLVGGVALRLTLRPRALTE